MVNDPDAPLVARIALGDRAAATALVNRHAGRIERLARRMLGDSAEAEDVTQEVFVRTWTQAARWQPGQARFETWLHRVALNLCYDRLRRKRGAALDDIPEPEDHLPGPAAHAEGAALARDVGAAMARLPERQRAAIQLCHFEGLSNIDAAAALEISIEALESLLSRGRRQLRDLLAAHAPDTRRARERLV